MQIKNQKSLGEAISGGEFTLLVIKVLYLNKFLSEQGSAVSLVKEKFPSTFAGFALWMIQKQLSKNEKFYGNKAFLF